MALGWSWVAWFDLFVWLVGIVVLLLFGYVLLGVCYSVYHCLCDLLRRLFGLLWFCSCGGLRVGFGGLVVVLDVGIVGWL